MKINFNQGYREDLPWFMRSSWEANVARVLLLYKKAGVLDRIEYEHDTFEFPIRHGTTRYRMDFTLWPNINGDFGILWDVISERVSFMATPYNGKGYIEVKGPMDSKSKTKLKRFKRYYPEEFWATTFVVWQDFDLRRKSKTTAHSWLYFLGAQNFWFYQELKRQFRGLVRWE